MEVAVVTLAVTCAALALALCLMTGTVIPLWWAVLAGRTAAEALRERVRRLEEDGGKLDAACAALLEWREGLMAGSTRPQPEATAQNNGRVAR